MKNMKLITKETMNDIGMNINVAFCDTSGNNDQNSEFNEYQHAIILTQQY